MLFDPIQFLLQKQQLKGFPGFAGEHLRRSLKVSLFWLTNIGSNID